MALMAGSASVLFICVLAFSGWPSDAQQLAAIDTENFVYTIKRKDFTFSQELEKDTPVTYTATLLDGSDLPDWLLYAQRSPTKDAYLYGTPPQISGKHRAIKLQVVAVNKDTYEMASRKVTVRRRGRSRAVALYEVEMVLDNMDITDFLASGRLREDLLRRVARAWRPDDPATLYFTHVGTLAAAGKHVPLPSGTVDGSKGGKEGLVVRVGSSQVYGDALRRVPIELRYPKSECRGKNGGGKTGLEKDGGGCVTVDADFQPEFVVDWREFRLLSKTEPEQRVDAEQPRSSFAQQDLPDDDDVIRDVVFVPRPNFPRRNFLRDFILCFLLPLIVLVVFAIFLTCVFFCHRTKRQARDRYTSPIQMVQYEHIREASDTLRHMSDHRDTTSPSPLLDQQVATSPADVPTQTPPPRHSFETTPLQQSSPTDHDFSPTSSSSPPAVAEKSIESEPSGVPSPSGRVESAPPPYTSGSELEQEEP